MTAYTCNYFSHNHYKLHT